jgi:glycosyltransferase involved in cell wall biosynthesis
MKIVLATGIYPPTIGGPATYVEQLAKECIRREQDVVVITYEKGVKDIEESDEGGRRVVRIAKWGGPYVRWRRYAKALKQYASDADAIIAFSSVSVGMPLRMAKLKKPHRFLRLGGDYFWERYTGLGGRRTLREWYKLSPPGFKHTVFDDAAYRLTQFLNRYMLHPLLRQFHHIVFTTGFQERMYKLHYSDLPHHSVIENSFPENVVIETSPHMIDAEELRARQFRLLYFGRLVGFKNLEVLLRAIALLPHARLTIVGEGPLAAKLRTLVQQLGVLERVSLLAPKQSSEKRALFADHDLMILPSLTDISPHSALEARAFAMPVLLTEETGLSEQLTKGMVLRKLREPEDIVRSVLEIEQNYEQITKDAMGPIPERSWEQVADEWMGLLKGVLDNAAHREEKSITEPDSTKDSMHKAKVRVH